MQSAPASGFGTVYAYTVVHRAPAAVFESSVPYVVALVDLDEGPRMMTNIVGCAPDEVAIGARVQVVFDGDGDFKVPVFTPRDGSGGEP